MMRYAARVILFICPCLWVTAVIAQETPQTTLAPAAVPAVYPEATPEAIDHWIGELGASRFDVRDHATRALIAAGDRAILPILKAARGRDREVALRSVVALQEIGARGDTDTLQASLAALDQAASEIVSPVVARQATEALESLTAVRQDRAMEFLRKLGATITRDTEDRWYQQFARFPFPSPVLAIEFGPEWQGEEKDLERLAWISDVEQVSFVGPRVRDSWFQYLRNLPRLHSVKVKRAQITNEGVAELAKIEGVWLLRLMFVPLDDSAVPLFENAKGLRKLLFISRELSEKGKADLQQMLGKDNVECPNGALLGVTTNAADGLNWTVYTVIAGSAADKAGILVNDRIVKYNGHTITDFPSLRAHIGRSEPGDTASLEIERGLERLTKQVTFGEWD